MFRPVLRFSFALLYPKNFGPRHAPFDRKNLVTFTFRGYLQALQRGTKRSSLAIGQHFQFYIFHFGEFAFLCFRRNGKRLVGWRRKQLSFPSTLASVNRMERFVLGLHFILNRLLQLAWECCEAGSTSRVEWPGSGCVWSRKLMTLGGGMS